MEGEDSRRYGRRRNYDTRPEVTERRERQYLANRLRRDQGETEEQQRAYRGGDNTFEGADYLGGWRSQEERGAQARTYMRILGNQYGDSPNPAQEAANRRATQEYLRELSEERTEDRRVLRQRLGGTLPGFLQGRYEQRRLEQAQEDAASTASGDSINIPILGFDRSVDTDSSRFEDSELGSVAGAYAPYEGNRRSEIYQRRGDSNWDAYNRRDPI